MKYHNKVSRVREHDQEVLDVVLGWVSLAHIANGVCNPAKDAASLWRLDPTTFGQMTSPQQERDLRDHTDVIYLSETTLTSFTSPRSHSRHSLTHFSSPFSPRWRPTPVQRHLSSNPVELFFPSRAFFSSPSSASCSSVPLFFPQEGLPTSTRDESSGSRGRSLGDRTDFCQRVYPSGVLLPRNYAPHFDSLLVNSVNQMKFDDFTPTIPPSSPKQGMIGQQPKGKPSLGRSTVRNRNLPTSLPSLGQPSSPDITLLKEHLLPNVTWSTLTTLGSDHLPKTSQSSFIHELPQG